MVQTENIEKVYLFEKDRVNSFKKWPYSASSPCNIQKVHGFGGDPPSNRDVGRPNIKISNLSDGRSRFLLAG